VVMVGFADGEGDVLLATNIIESGLDVPRANTMIIWRPDRFGLAQLHQLRGRVGRGRRQGFAYLLHAEDEELSEATRARLSTLEALDRLGSGFAISARDLDLRGGGDLVGDEQAGHMRMIGASLYQRVLEGALRTARGERPLNLGEPIYSGDATAALPDTYIPDATTRINLYARLARLSSTADIEAFGDELEDRFGPLPEPAAALIANARLNALAHEAGVEAIASGPKATAFAFGRAAASVAKRVKDDEVRHWKDDRLIYPAGDAPHDAAFIEGVLADLAA
jgi:transcription-repair coupling factor (superfamily II helicase)